MLSSTRVIAKIQQWSKIILSSSLQLKLETETLTKRTLHPIVLIDLTLLFLFYYTTFNVGDVHIKFLFTIIEYFTKSTTDKCILF